jgi:aminomethyltransferase
MSETTASLQRTPLWETHQNLKARLVPFAGWDMPVQYAGVIPEVRAVRENCGLFDVSHMGQFVFSGPRVTDELNKIVSADWSRVAVGRAAYALLLNDNGGVIDDIMGYRLSEDEWLIVVNASRANVDEAHFRAQLSQNITFRVLATRMMLAIQGPQAESILQPLTQTDLSTLKWRDVVRAEVAGVAGILTRGGYTGCDGFEFMTENASPDVWNALLKNGATPCGLGARDVLRLEAGLPLYGHELREDWTPQESGVGFAAKIEKSDFIGRDALLHQQPARKIRGLKMQSKAIAREGYRVLDSENNVIGEVTSGTMSVALGCGIALAMLPIELQIGDTVNIEIRNATHAAQIVALPFVEHGKKGAGG